MASLVSVTLAGFCGGSVFIRETVSGKISWSNASLAPYPTWSELNGTEVCTGAFAADGERLVCLDAQALKVFVFTLNNSVADGSMAPSLSTYSLDLPSNAQILPNSQLLYWNMVTWNTGTIFDFFCIFSNSLLHCGTYQSSKRISLMTSPPYTGIFAATYVRETPRIFTSRLPLICHGCTQVLATTKFNDSYTQGNGSYSGDSMAYGTSPVDPFRVMFSAANNFVGVDNTTSTSYLFDSAINYLGVFSTSLSIIDAVPSQRTCTGVLLRFYSGTQPGPIDPRALINQQVNSTLLQNYDGNEVVWYSGPMSGFAWTPKVFNWPTVPSPPSAAAVPHPEYPTDFAPDGIEEVSPDAPYSSSHVPSNRPPSFLALTPIHEGDAPLSTNPRPPRPAPQDVTFCPGVAPDGNFFCQNGAWYINKTLSERNITFDGKARIQGSLIITNETVFRGLYSSVDVTDCYNIDGIVLLDLTDDEFQDLWSQNVSTLRLINGTACSENATSNQFEIMIRTPSKSCQTVTTRPSMDSDALVAIFSVNTIKCKIWWISLGSTVGFIFLVAVVIGLVFTCNQKCRHKVRPFSQ